MKKSIGFLFVALIGFGLVDVAPADTLNDHLLSLVRSYNQLDSKLERHEHRERSLGEFIKKILQSLQIGQRSLEPMKGIFSRLDERVSQIETLLMAQEQRYNLQSEKNDEVIKLIKQLEENSRKNVDAVKEPVVVESSVNAELLAEVRALTATIAKLFEVSTNLVQKTDSISQRAPRTEELITRMEKRLVGLHAPPPVTTTQAPFILDNSEFENKVMESIKNIATNIDELKAVTPPPPPAHVVQPSAGLEQADKDFIQGLVNETLTAVENLKSEALIASDKAVTKITTTIKDSESIANANVDNLDANLSEIKKTLNTFYNEMNVSYNALNDGLAAFNKIILSNSDEILKTQRKVEFGTHQISQKVTDIIEAQQLELSQALMKRLDDMDESILNNHEEALQNITATMESEIRDVWRQLTIMHGEMTDSKDALNNLTGQTEVYVNGTFSTMDGLEGKVGQITKRMLDVDENLNFLLGRLSLTTQEFNHLRIGLEEAMNKIRDSFREVREKVNPGPGPHNIAKNEYETDFNLLSKRNAL